MAFEFKKSLRGTAMPPLVRVIIDNSDTVKLGMAVKAYNAGNAEVATAARPLLGFIHAVTDKDGLRPATDSGTDDTWTVASDNETVDQYACLVDCDPMSVYSVAPDATIGTTNSSDKIGCAIDLASGAITVDEDTATRSGSAQLYGWGADPDDTTRMLVSIMESEMRAGGTYS